MVVVKEVLMREGEAGFFPIMRNIFASLYIVLVRLIRSINDFHQKLITRVVQGWRKEKGMHHKEVRQRTGNY